MSMQVADADDTTTRSLNIIRDARNREWHNSGSNYPNMAYTPLFRPLNFPESDQISSTDDRNELWNKQTSDPALTTKSNEIVSMNTANSLTADTCMNAGANEKPKGAKKRKSHSPVSQTSRSKTSSAEDAYATVWPPDRDKDMLVEGAIEDTDRSSSTNMFSRAVSVESLEDKMAKLPKLKVCLSRVTNPNQYSISMPPDNNKEALAQSSTLSSNQERPIPNKTHQQYSLPKRIPSEEEIQDAVSDLPHKLRSQANTDALVVAWAKNRYCCPHPACKWYCKDARYSSDTSYGGPYRRPSSLRTILIHWYLTHMARGYMVPFHCPGKHIRGKGLCDFITADEFLLRDHLGHCDGTEDEKDTEIKRQKAYIERQIGPFYMPSENLALPDDEIEIEKDNCVHKLTKTIAEVTSSSESNQVGSVKDSVIERNQLRQEQAFTNGGEEMQINLFTDKSAPSRHNEISPSKMIRNKPCPASKKKLLARNSMLNENVTHTTPVILNETNKIPHQNIPEELKETEDNEELMSITNEAHIIPKKRGRGRKRKVPIDSSDSTHIDVLQTPVITGNSQESSIADNFVTSTTSVNEISSSNPDKPDIISQNSTETVASQSLQNGPSAVIEKTQKQDDVVKLSSDSTPIEPETRILGTVCEAYNMQNESEPIKEMIEEFPDITHTPKKMRLAKNMSFSEQENNKEESSVPLPVSISSTDKSGANQDTMTIENTSNTPEQPKESEMENPLKNLSPPETGPKNKRRRGRGKKTIPEVQGDSSQVPDETEQNMSKADSVNLDEIFTMGKETIQKDVSREKDQDHSDNKGNLESNRNENIIETNKNMEEQHVEKEKEFEDKTPDAQVIIASSKAIPFSDCTTNVKKLPKKRTGRPKGKAKQKQREESLEKEDLPITSNSNQVENSNESEKATEDQLSTQTDNVETVSEAAESNIVDLTEEDDDTETPRARRHAGRAKRGPTGKRGRKPKQLHEHQSSSVVDIENRQHELESQKKDTTDHTSKQITTNDVSSTSEHDIAASEVPVNQTVTETQSESLIKESLNENTRKKSLEEIPLQTNIPQITGHIDPEKAGNGSSNLDKDEHESVQQKNNSSGRRGRKSKSRATSPSSQVTEMTSNTVEVKRGRKPKRNQQLSQDSNKTLKDNLEQTPVNLDSDVTKDDNPEKGHPQNRPDSVSEMDTKSSECLNDESTSEINESVDKQPAKSSAKPSGRGRKSMVVVESARKSKNRNKAQNVESEEVPEEGRSEEDTDKNLSNLTETQTKKKNLSKTTEENAERENKKTTGNRSNRSASRSKSAVVVLEDVSQKDSSLEKEQSKVNTLKRGRRKEALSKEAAMEVENQETQVVSTDKEDDSNSNKENNSDSVETVESRENNEDETESNINRNRRGRPSRTKTSKQKSTQKEKSDTAEKSKTNDQCENAKSLRYQSINEKIQDIMLECTTTLIAVMAKCIDNNTNNLTVHGNTMLQTVLACQEKLNNALPELYELAGTNADTNDVDSVSKAEFEKKCDEVNSLEKRLVESEKKYEEASVQFSKDQAESDIKIATLSQQLEEARVQLAVTTGIQTSTNTASASQTSAALSLETNQQIEETPYKKRRSGRGGPPTQVVSTSSSLTTTSTPIPALTPPSTSTSPTGAFEDSILSCDILGNFLKPKQVVGVFDESQVESAMLGVRNLVRMLASVHPINQMPQSILAQMKPSANNPEQNKK